MALRARAGRTDHPRRAQAPRRAARGSSSRNRQARVQALLRQGPAGWLHPFDATSRSCQSVKLNQELQSLVPDRVPPLLTVDQRAVGCIRETPWPPCAPWATSTTRDHRAAAALAGPARCSTWTSPCRRHRQPALHHRRPLLWSGPRHGRPPRAGLCRSGPRQRPHLLCRRRPRRHQRGLTRGPPHRREGASGRGATELVPFRSAIQAGVTIMTAHVLFLPTTKSARHLSPHHRGGSASSSATAGWSSATTWR